MVISMCFSEFASTFFERPVRRNRWILWGGMVFFHDFDQWFACQQVILILFFGRGVRLIEPATPEVARFFFASCWPNLVSTEDQGTISFTRRDILSAWRDTCHLEHFQNKYFETCFWTNNNLFLNKQQLIFERTGLTTIGTQNVLRPHVLTLSCLGCQTVACLTMIKHCSWEFSELSWHHAFPATRPGRSATFETLWFETYGTIRFWQHLFFEQPFCETQLFDTWVHAACMVWSALIFLSWWKETRWI